MSDATDLLTGDPIIDEARKRRRRVAEWEANWRPLFIQDIKFANGDDENGYQWPNSIRRSRDVSARPCLTMNIIKQHNLMIKNSALQNKVEVKIIGAGGGATADSAQMLNDIVGSIQYDSDAQAAYAMARAFQVDGGLGYWRLATDYAGPDTFDMVAKILPVPDPLSIYLDYSVRQRDGSDAEFGFVFDRCPREKFADVYPKWKHLNGTMPLGDDSYDFDWTSKDHTVVCEYFRKVWGEDELFSFIDPSNGLRKEILRSKLPDEVIQAIKGSATSRRRDVWLPKIEWKLIVGEKVIDETIWPGSFVPIVRCLGEETIIGGILDRKGHTRGMMGAQRMYNYNASGQVEFVALQSKTPWTGAKAAIESLESVWNTANISNHAYLPFNHLDDDGNPIPPDALPRRQDPPNASPAFEAGMQTAFTQMMMTSGQWQNAMGMAGNERTGAAIDKRIDQGDVATFHFDDNFHASIVFTGKQLIELIPKVYDTRRILHIQANDGSSQEIELDPKLQEAARLERNAKQQVVRRIFNPQVGKYEVRAVPGSAKGSKREQTVEALTLILTQAPALTGVIGDILMAAMDFPQAQEAAQRLKRMVPPQALGIGPTQAEQGLQVQLHQMQIAMAELMKKLGKEQLKLTGKGEMRDIDAYKAETERLKVLLAGQEVDPRAVKAMVEQLMKEAAETHLAPILEANAGDVDEEEEEEPPMPGAQKAPDGEWYLRDPTRTGKYLRLAPLAQEKSTPGVVANG